MLNIQSGSLKKFACAFILGFFLTASLIASIASEEEEDGCHPFLIRPKLTALPPELLDIILLEIDLKTLRALRPEHSIFNASYKSRRRFDIKIDGKDVEKFIEFIRSRNPFKVLNSLTLTGMWQGRGKDESLDAILRPVKYLDGLVLEGLSLTLKDAQYLYQSS